MADADLTRWEQIKRDMAAKAQEARKRHEHTGLPWRDPNCANGWTFLCSECGEPVDCGWDDGFGLPHGVDPWRGRAEIEGECEVCGSAFSVAIVWWFAFEAERPELTRDGSKQQSA